MTRVGETPMRLAPRLLTRHPRAATAVAATAGAAVVIVLALWPGTRSAPAAVTPPPTRARAYTDYSACLLTGPTGIADAQAAPVWAGLQSASGATRAQASYLQLQGPQTAANAASYVNALALRGCSLILTAGTVPGQGADARAGAFPRIRFITVDAPTGASANLTAVASAAPATVTKQISALVVADSAATDSTS